MLLNRNKLKVLNEFSIDYRGRIYGRGISKKLEINQKTVSNILNELEKEHILKFKQEGKNKYYYLNEFYPYIKEIIQLIETQKKINSNRIFPELLFRRTLNFSTKPSDSLSRFPKVTESPINRIRIVEGGLSCETSGPRNPAELIRTATLPLLSQDLSYPVLFGMSCFLPSRS